MESVSAGLELGSWGDLLVPSVLWPVSIGLALYMFQVLSGLDPVLVYTVDIFRAAGTELDEYTSTIIIGSIQTVMPRTLGTRGLGAKVQV
jgi:hypothetical protein